MPGAFTAYVRIDAFGPSAGGLSGHEVADRLRGRLEGGGAGVLLDPEADGLGISALVREDVLGAVAVAQAAGLVAASYDADAQALVIAAEDLERADGDAPAAAWPLEAAGYDGEYWVRTEPDAHPDWSGRSAAEVAEIVQAALERIGEPGTAEAEAGLVDIPLSSLEAVTRLADELGLDGYADPLGIFGDGGGQQDP